MIAMGIWLGLWALSAWALIHEWKRQFNRISEIQIVLSMVVSMFPPMALGIWAYMRLSHAKDQEDLARFRSRLARMREYEFRYRALDENPEWTEEEFDRAIAASKMYPDGVPKGLVKGS